ncbi:hypothetical protein J6590_086178 [Homalodisca vitripennis]|nr:hypothetical protein J6590_086178 [Homalodisca vitripennis]
MYAPPLVHLSATFNTRFTVQACRIFNILSDDIRCIEDRARFGAGVLVLAAVGPVQVTGVGDVDKRGN